MPMFRRLTLAALAVPLALALGACRDDEAAGPSAGEPVAPVAAPAGQQWADVAAITPEGGWLIGNPEAPIKLVEYGSLTCPACAHFSTTGIPQLRDDYVNSGRVSFELRSVPLHGAIDLVLTRLLECAPKEAVHPLAEQMWANNAAIMTPLQTNAAAIEQAMLLPDNQRFVAYAQAAGLLDFFAARGISTEQARQCLSDFAAMNALAQRLQMQNTKDNITGTPTFFVNGREIELSPGPSWPQVETALQNAGAR
jgi:protein-disulfide isomerase